MFSDNLVATVSSSVGNGLKNNLLDSISPSEVRTDGHSSDEDDDMLPPSPVHSYQTK